MRENSQNGKKPHFGPQKSGFWGSEGINYMKAARNAIDKSDLLIHQTQMMVRTPRAMQSVRVTFFDDCMAMNIEFAILISGK